MTPGIGFRAVRCHFRGIRDALGPLWFSAAARQRLSAFHHTPPSYKAPSMSDYALLATLTVSTLSPTIVTSSYHCIVGITLLRSVIARYPHHHAPSADTCMAQDVALEHIYCGTAVFC